MMRRRGAATILGLAASMAITSAAGAHHPDPAFAGALFAQDQHVEYRWRSGQVPPLWMRGAVNAAAADNNGSRLSKAATFGYDSAAPSQVAYGTPDVCGAGAAGCMRRYAPDSFNMWLRPHGYQMDWGTFRWCEAYETPPNGCYDAEAVALHEFGHVQILNHHAGETATEADYRDSIMNSVARPKPSGYYDAHRYAKCDVATLQRKYDVRDWSYAIAQCQTLDTTLTIAASDQSVNYRAPVTFDVELRIRDLDAYGRLGFNPLQGRTVTLQRRVPGATTWTSVSNLADQSDGIGYAYTATPASTYEWRAVFLAPDNEGLEGATSGVIRVNVGSCTGSTCPQVADTD